MAYTIEDTIIAYFDGRLNDEDSADLLHRASVSPEIRSIFQQHAALRRMAVRAAQHTTIAPELEESLFSRIQELRNEEQLPVGFWSVRRFAFAATAMALILVGVANSFQTQESRNIIALKPGTDRIANQYDLSYASLTPSTHPATTLHSVDHTKMSMYAPAPENGPVAHDDAEPEIRIHPEPRTLAAIPTEIPISQSPTMQSLRELARPNTFSAFEVGVAAPISGGFAVPASSQSLGLFADQTIFAAYNLDNYNQIGVQLTNGIFPHLIQASTNPGAGFTSVTGELSTKQAFIGQIFYRHREPVNGLFFVVGGMGGGLSSSGTVVSAELGIEIPFSDHLLGGVSFVADRLSQKGQTPSQIMDASSTPVIYSGSSALNTLTGRIEYALMYQF